MATGTFLIVLIPSYQSIGLWAPLLVLCGRLLQGFSAGAELGGVSVYLAEIATPGRKGFYTSWQSGSQQVAIMVAAAMGFALNAALEESAIREWGMAPAFPVRLPDRSLHLPTAPQAGRNTGNLPPAATTWRCATCLKPC